MQSINAAAPTPLFLVTLLGTALVSVVLGISSLARLDQTGAGFQLAGSALYVAAVLVTVVHHVPSNEALATVDPRAPDAGGHWLR